MRTTTVRWGALAAVLALLLGGAAMGQQPGDPNGQKKPAEEKKPSQLEELIAQALRDNPDIRVAEAKTREAEAELNRARLQVIQKVVSHQHTVETLEGAVKVGEANYAVAEAKLKLAEADFKRMSALRNAVAQSDLDQAQANRDQARAGVETAKAALQSAKADLAKAQAELPYLLGKGGKDDKQTEATKHALEWLKGHVALEHADESATARGLYALSIAQAQAAWTAAEQPRGTVANKLRKALDKPVTLRFEEEMRLGDILDYLEKAAGVSMATTLPRDTKLRRIDIRDVALGTAFQCVEDLERVQFGVRDYGILVSDKLPSGVTRLHDFWKEGDKPKAGEEKPKSSGRNPPPGKVEGKVTRVDAGSGLVEISIGSDDGLAEGQTMEVYRTGGDKGATKYLGTLRIEKTNAGNSVGKFTNKLDTPVEVGDRVSSKFFVD